MNSYSLANFVIGGTEKAGTTSIFMYLSEHPMVCGSVVKETDFFRQEYTGDKAVDVSSYAKYFRRCTRNSHIIMEASPGYLGEASAVAPKIQSFLPDTKILFVLRNPVDRLYSSYNFHKSKYDIPEDCGFGEYVEMCLAYERNNCNSDNLRLEEWHLKTLKFGCYADHLRVYLKYFPKENIKIMFFESLVRDLPGFMNELSDFLEIDKKFWSTYEFRKSNVTFSGKNKLLHKAAMGINARTESFFRQKPELKNRLVKIYKCVNQSNSGYAPIDELNRKTLDNYYSNCNRKLEDLYRGELSIPW